ncbi:MAG: c-type cytochrome [Steroidobacteraceae bacterium]
MWCISFALLTGCERERREFHAAPVTQDTHPRLTRFQPGAPIADETAGIGVQYERNAYHIARGGTLFRSFNCNGCHGAGGGAIGPALMDDQWRYGSGIEQIHASILEGRPNGMPSWRGKLTDQQAWQLAAYVRSLSGNVSKAAAPSRHEDMQSTPPLNQVPQEPERGPDPSSLNPAPR